MSIATMDVTLAVTTTPQQLYALLAAINPNASRYGAMVEIQGDDANGDSWLVGDSNLATTRYSFKGLNGGDLWRDESQNDTNRISYTNLYLRSVSGTQTVHCRVRTT